MGLWGWATGGPEIKIEVTRDGKQLTGRKQAEPVDDDVIDYMEGREQSVTWGVIAFFR